MKKLILGLLMTFVVFNIAYSQKVEMKVGEKIDLVVITEGSQRGAVNFEQNNCKLKYRNMFKTLESIEACSENMAIARKHRTGVLVMNIVGWATFPIGWLIVVLPSVNKKLNEMKYVKLAVEDYNASL